MPVSPSCIPECASSPLSCIIYGFGQLLPPFCSQFLFCPLEFSSPLHKDEFFTEPVHCTTSAYKPPRFSSKVSQFHPLPGFAPCHKPLCAFRYCYWSHCSVALRVICTSERGTEELLANPARVCDAAAGSIRSASGWWARLDQWSPPVEVPASSASR